MKKISILCIVQSCTSAIGNSKIEFLKTVMLNITFYVLFSESNIDKFRSVIIIISYLV